MAQRELEPTLDHIASAGKSPRERLRAFESREGDCVFLYVEDAPYYRERVNELFTVYQAVDDDRVVGVEIKGISRLPIHDALQINLGTRLDTPGQEIEVIQLLLLTLRHQAQIPGRSIGQREFERYFKAFGALGGGRTFQVPEFLAGAP